MGIDPFLDRIMDSIGLAKRARKLFGMVNALISDSERYTFPKLLREWTNIRNVIPISLKQWIIAQSVIGNVSVQCNG